MEQGLGDPPIRVAVRNDYEVVVAGVTAMLQPFSDRVRVVDVSTGSRAAKGVPVDVTLFDTFGQSDVSDSLEALIADPAAGRVVLYTWNMNPALARMAAESGACGYLPKAFTSRQLVDAVVRIYHGEVVTAKQSLGSREAQGGWPGKEFGLTGREADMVSLVTQGLTNEEIARLCFISINSVKTYIRSAYRKIGVASRSEAVLWGVRHGLLIGDRPPSGSDPG